MSEAIRHDWTAEEVRAVHDLSLFELIDRATVKGEGPDARVVTASPPYPGLNEWKTRFFWQRSGEAWELFKKYDWAIQPQFDLYGLLMWSVNRDTPGLAAGPVPWIHCRSKSGGISLPANPPARAARTVRLVRPMTSSGSRKRISSRSCVRCVRRLIRAAITSRLSASKRARAVKTSLASSV